MTVSLADEGLWLVIALGAGLGAVVRAQVDRGVIVRVGPTRLPWATLAVNVAGSLLLGVVLGWASGRPGPSGDALRLVVGTGFCGGLTTYSTCSVESFLLLRDGRARAALCYLGLTVGAGMAAVVLGDLLGSALV